MAEELKAADVFVEFSSKGAEQVEKDADKVAQKAKQTQQKTRESASANDQAEQQRQRRMEQQQEKMTQGQFQRMKDVARFKEKMADAGMGEHSAAGWAAADARKQAQAAEQKAREDEQAKFVTADQFKKIKMNDQAKIKAMDSGSGKFTEQEWRQAEQRKAKEEEKRQQEQKESRREQKVAAVAGIQLAKQAFGALPFVGGAASIIQTGIMGGPMAAAGQAAAQGIGYGIQGAQKASPQEWGRMEYQADRLQAIIGQKFVPVVQQFGNWLEKLGTIAGGPGAQLSLPQYSDFASIRDRLQISALQGLGKPAEGPTANARYARAGLEAVKPFEGGLGLVGVATWAGRNIMDAWNSS